VRTVLAPNRIPVFGLEHDVAVSLEVIAKRIDQFPNARNFCSAAVQGLEKSWSGTVRCYRCSRRAKARHIGFRQYIPIELTSQSLAEYLSANSGPMRGHHVL
jgi:hypothetical protein